jgi:hypothetical protein
MKIRVLLLAVLVLATSAKHGTASPITYEFSGTLAQPINGSTAFSGTFSYELTTTEFGAGDLLTRSVGSHAMLNVGGKSFDFINYSFTELGPSPTYTFDANSKGQGDNFIFQGDRGTIASSSAPSSQSAAMTIHLGDPSGTAFPASGTSLPKLNLSSFAIRDFSVTLNPPASSAMSAVARAESGGPVTGTITTLSVEAQTVPEPTTLALFTLIGLGVAARRRLRRRV